LAGCTLGTSGILLALEKDQEAVEMWGSAQRLYKENSAKMIPPIDSEYKARFARVEKQMGETDFKKAYQVGYARRRDEIWKRVRQILQEVQSGYTRRS
jgi:hypothetical protein